MSYLPIKDRRDIVRDEKTGAVLSVDMLSYQTRLRQINLTEQKKQEEHQKKIELNTLREEIHNLKQAVNEFLEKDSD
jgi:hypothetical protein